MAGGKTLLSLLLMLSTTPALAENWVKVSMSGSGTIYIDQESAARDGNRISFWDSLVFDTPRTLSSIAAPVKESRMYVTVDCVAHTGSGKSPRAFGADGKIVASSDGEGPTQSVEAGSSLYDEFQYACSHW